MVTRRSKKTTKKKTRKKVKKKAAKRSKRTKRKATLKLTEDPEVLSIDRDIKIWECYARVQSIREVARETGFAVSLVRSTLANDKARLERIKQDHIEHAASRWEKKRDQALELVDRIHQMYLGDLLAIEAAVKEGRTITTIRGEDGIPLPVLGARELMVKSRMMDQVIKLAAQAESTAASLRAGHVPTVGGEGGGGAEGIIPTDMSKMNDLQLVEMIEGLGDKAPVAMRLRAANIRKKQREALGKVESS